MIEIEQLENDLRKASPYPEFFQELLDEYALLISKLGMTQRYDKLIDIADIRDALEKRLPDVSDEEFEEFVVLTGMLGAIDSAVRRSI